MRFLAQYLSQFKTRPVTTMATGDTTLTIFRKSNSAINTVDGRSFEINEITPSGQEKDTFPMLTIPTHVKSACD